MESNKLSKLAPEVTYTGRKAFFEYCVNNDRNLEEYRGHLHISDRKNDFDGLNSKNIVLVGGGKSDIAGELEFYHGVLPESVWNIDPYADPVTEKEVFYTQKTCKNMAKNVKKMVKSNQILVPKRFTDVDIVPDFADEMWALFSLPHYCETLEELKAFWAKGVIGTAPEGNFRVYPNTPRSHDEFLVNLFSNTFDKFARGLRTADRDVHIEQHESYYGTQISSIIQMPKSKEKVNRFARGVLDKLDMNNQTWLHNNYDISY